MNALRICIPIEFRPEGGGHYFLRAFAEYASKTGAVITKDVSEDCDVLFTNHWMTPRSEILKCLRHNKNVRIVQRIDGVAQDYGRKDDADFRQSAVNQLADLTIFQSEYSRFASREKYKIIAQDGPVIHNPVDISLFTPDAPRQKLIGSRKIACVSWSTNPQKGSTQIYSVAAQNSEIDFFLCGNFPNPPALANIHLQGVLGRAELARLLRSCDLLLTFSKNEACPNHVLEALASGLPVLYDDSGAMQEIIGGSGLPVTPENFSAQAEQVYSQLAVFSEGARNRATSMFDPNKIFAKYSDRIERALYEPTVLSPIRRQWMAWSALIPQ